MIVYRYGRGAASTFDQPSPSSRRSPWDKIRDEVALEHRVIENHEPDSPRVRPSLGSVGWIVR
jgi:hypothetical protein